MKILKSECLALNNFQTTKSKKTPIFQSQNQHNMIWTAKPIKHNNENRIAVYFEKNQDLIARIKQIEGARWSQQKTVWHLPDTTENRERFKIEPLANSLPSPEGIVHIEKFKQWLRSKRYSESTLTTYSEALKSFLIFYREKPITEINNEDVIIYNNEYILKNNLSASYQNQIVNAIKLFFRTIQNKQIEIDKIHRPKRAKLLPNVLSKEEIKAILEASNNIKHKTMLSLVYSCGLRCGELLALQPVHIDSKRNIVLLKNSKGKKDRIVPLSPKILEMLRSYFVLFKPTVYLFEGRNKGQPYDDRSLQQVLKQAIKKAEITKQLPYIGCGIVMQHIF